MKRKFNFLIAAVFTALILMMALPVSASETVPVSVETSETAEPNSETAAESENFFTQIYESALTHSAEIFSFLSLIGTVVISYLYKRGLLPSVKSTLSSLGSAVGKIKESNDRQCEEQKYTADRIEERLSGFENTLALYGESLKALEAHLISDEEMRKQKSRSDLILSSQIDMLYDIFMTSSIPHYQKEATGERINKMRKEMEEYESTDFS